jgi:hypothetical protein
MNSCHAPHATDEDAQELGFRRSQLRPSVQSSDDIARHGREELHTAMCQLASQRKPELAAVVTGTRRALTAKPWPSGSLSAAASLIVDEKLARRASLLLAGEAEAQPAKAHGPATDADGYAAPAGLRQLLSRSELQASSILVNPQGHILVSKAGGPRRIRPSRQSRLPGN